jgi:hypothetical protein
MSLSDFDSLTSLEAEAIINRHILNKEEQYKTDWERARFIACNALLPHVKKRLKPTDVCKFPWEKANNREDLSLEEKEAVRKRGQELAKKWQ